MRPRIIDFLNQTIGVTFFNYIIPDPELLYPIAFLLIALVFAKRCKKLGINRTVILGTIFAGGIGAFIGAKLIYIIMHFESYIILPSHIFAPGGTMSWGAYVGAILGLLIYLHYKGESILRYLDVLGSSLGLGPFIGRWSCFLNGDDYGTITNIPWAVQYPAESMPFAAHIHSGIISYTASHSASVHPNQIYLSLNGLFLFVVMSWLWKKYNHIHGLTFGLYCLGYGMLRFILEYFRDEQPSSLISTFNNSQIFSLGTAITGGIFLIYRFYPNLKIIVMNYWKKNKS